MRKIMLALVVMLGVMIVATHAAYNAGISHAINSAILMRDYSGHKPYKDFLTYAELVEHNERYDRIDRTPDGVPWESDKLGYKELNEMMWELGR